VIILIFFILRGYKSYTDLTKNIAGLTYYIQLNSKQTKRPPHLLHCRRNEVP